MKQIIIADDDPGIREVFQHIFKRAGYNVTIYPNGDAIMQNDFELPDLFIVDKQLSGIDGLEICRFLKSQEPTKNIPVIMISASPYAAKISIETGADDFIEKPFKMKALLETIGKHVNNDNNKI